ncbi:NAD(P)-binding domain-containing protein [Treponema sp. OttesenSCG-928-L16]|nr:NAD(P)-binding domain-containing protein [Treponema sp. OttesenSCG-928-L16]
MKKISFIGTGVIGRSMAGHLINAGCALTVYSRTEEKASAGADLAAQAVYLLYAAGRI